MDFVPPFPSQLVKQRLKHIVPAKKAANITFFFIILIFDVFVV
jgi:hypothetical protein